MMEPLARAQPFMVSSDEFNLRFFYIVYLHCSFFSSCYTLKQYLTLSKMYQVYTTY